MIYIEEKIIIQSNEKKIKKYFKIRIISIIVCAISLIILFIPNPLHYGEKYYDLMSIIQEISLWVLLISSYLAVFTIVIKFKSTLKVTNTKVFGKREGNIPFELSINDIAQIELFSEKQIKITDINNNIYYFPGVSNAEEIIKIVKDIKEKKN